MHFTVIEKSGSFTNTTMLSQAITKLLNDGCYAYYANSQLSPNVTEYLEENLPDLSVSIIDSDQPTKLADIVLVLHNHPKCRYEIHDNILMPIEDCF